MAYTTINKSSEHFNTKLYTGNGSTQSITGVGFQPDWVWQKARNQTYDHRLFDAVRGTTKAIFSNTTGVEGTESGVTAFDSDGFSLGSNAGSNGNTVTYASWNWKANGQGSSNTDGSTNTTYTSVNTTAGFSISSYAGSGSLATIGHGLGVAPKVVLIKSTSHTESWTMYHASLGAGKYIYLNNTDAAGGGGSNTSIFNNTAPTNSVFTVNTDGTVNGSGKNYIAYCFADVTGYSKIGSYTGNGSADGTFVYTGFKPAFVMVKDSTSAGYNWLMYDNKRLGYNVDNKHLVANENYAEAGGSSDNPVDLLSNGFKFRIANQNTNRTDTYIYMAFAEAPLVGSNNVPCTAR